MEIVKICKKHGELTIENCRIEYSDGYKCLRCVFCRREKDFKWKSNNREKHRASASKARNLDRTKANEWAKNDRENNPDKYKKWSEQYRKRHGKNIITNEICRFYKLTRIEYDELLRKCDNKCHICKKEETCKGRTQGTVKRLAVDHCHKTNRIRGILCDNCNKMIGHAKDSIEIFELAIGYLIQFID